MTWGTLAWLALAGAVAGLVGNVAGLASLVSYPALVAAGLGPIAANVTNTVALLGAGIGGIHGARPELTGQRARVIRLAAPAVLGGAAGGVLLLFTSPDAFTRIVPWLIGIGSIAILIRPRPAALPGGDSLAPDVTPPGTRERSAEDAAARRHDLWLWAGTFLISVYGGYFGAAAGVLLLALMLLFTGESVARGSALRTAVLFLANGIAAVYFMVFGPVDWLAALFMGAGFIAGSRLGPIVLRHSPDAALRALIALSGVGLAVHLGIQAYT